MWLSPVLIETTYLILHIEHRRFGKLSGVFSMSNLCKFFSNIYILIVDLFYLTISYFWSSKYVCQPLFFTFWWVITSNICACNIFTREQQCLVILWSLFWKFHFLNWTKLLRGSTSCLFWNNNLFLSFKKWKTSFYCP